MNHEKLDFHIQNPLSKDREPNRLVSFFEVLASSGTSPRPWSFFVKKYPDFHIFHLEYLFLYYFKPCLVNCQQIWARDGHSPHSKLAMTSKNCEKEKESLPTLCGLSWLYWKAWVWSRWRRWEQRGQAQGQPYHGQLVRYIYDKYYSKRWKELTAVGSWYSAESVLAWFKSSLIIIIIIQIIIIII